jgi:DNA-binding MarR family transcriptional regulator
MDGPTELFVERVGSHFAEQYGLPPLTGRALGWLLVCDPPEQRAAQIAAALSASRGGISGAVATLESMRFIQRRRPIGSRADLISVVPSAWARGLEASNEFDRLEELARSGLTALGDAGQERAARLTELAEFAGFFAERMPALFAEWQQRRLVLGFQIDETERDEGVGR